MLMKMASRVLDLVVMFIIVILFLSGLAIYLISGHIYPHVAHLELKEISFEMGERYRSIVLTLSVKEGFVEIKQVFINDSVIHEWQADKKIVWKGGESRITLVYPWVMRETYTVKIITADDHVIEFQVKAPEEKPLLFMKINNVSVIGDENNVRIKVEITAEGRGISSFQALLFTYLSFNQTDRRIYVFCDERYMAGESLRRAKEIADLLSSYNFSVIKADYRMLEELARSRPKCVLIIVNPFRDFSGRRIEDALPAPLIDPDGNGFIRDNSKYKKSLLYDWMKDDGLIFVTIGSIEPYKRIIYEDGSYKYARDSFDLLDAHLLLTDASGVESILGGNMFIGDYSPTRITGSLGLHYRESRLAFNKNSLENYGLSYYGYGDYKVSAENVVLNLTLPVFIRVGNGGWLSLGDEEDWLKPEEIAHDVLMLMVHSIWDSNWIPYGWYWDSGTIYHQSGGIITIKGSIETELIPKRILGDRVVIRLVGLAFSEDLKSGVIVEEIFEYNMSGTHDL